MNKNLIIDMVAEQCVIYNSLMNTDGVSKYIKGHLDGVVWTLDKMGIVITTQRFNGLCCNPIEKVTFYFEDEDYIAKVYINNEN